MSFKAVIDPNWKTDEGGGGRGAGEHYELDDVSAIAEGYYRARDNDGRRIWPQLNTRAPMLVFMWATTSAMQQPDEIDVRQGELVDAQEAFKPPVAYVLARLLGLRVCATFVWCKVDDVTCPVCHGTGTALRQVSVDFMLAMGDSYPGPAPCGTCDGAGVIGMKAPAQMGIGQWSRCEHEFLLLCRRGVVPVPAPADRPRSVIYAPRVLDERNRVVHSAKPPQAWSQVINPIARSSMPDRVGIEFNARTRQPGWSAFGALDGEKKPLRFEEDRPDAT